MDHQMSTSCDGCGGLMGRVADVPDVGTGTGVRFFECTNCNVHKTLPISWGAPTGQQSEALT